MDPVGRPVPGALCRVAAARVGIPIHTEEYPVWPPVVPSFRFGGTTGARVPGGYLRRCDEVAVEVCVGWVDFQMHGPGGGSSDMAPWFLAPGQKRGDLNCGRKKDVLRSWTSIGDWQPFDAIGSRRLGAVASSCRRILLEDLLLDLQSFVFSARGAQRGFPCAFEDGIGRGYCFEERHTW